MNWVLNRFLVATTGSTMTHEAASYVGPFWPAATSLRDGSSPPNPRTAGEFIEVVGTVLHHFVRSGVRAADQHGIDLADEDTSSRLIVVDTRDKQRRIHDARFGQLIPITRRYQPEHVEEYGPETLRRWGVGGPAGLGRLTDQIAGDPISWTRDQVERVRQELLVPNNRTDAAGDLGTCMLFRSGRIEAFEPYDSLGDYLGQQLML